MRDSSGRLLGNEKTTWTCRHRFRRVIARPELHRKLRGGVEVGTVTVGKAQVAVAVEIREERRRDVRGDAGDFRRLPFGSGRSGKRLPVTHPLHQGCRCPRTQRIRSHGRDVYDDLDGNGNFHRVVNKRPKTGNERFPWLLPKVCDAAVLLERRFGGIFKNGVQPKHLDFYLAEFRIPTQLPRARSLSFLPTLPSFAVRSNFARRPTGPKSGARTHALGDPLDFSALASGNAPGAMTRTLCGGRWSGRRARGRVGRERPSSDPHSRYATARRMRNTCLIPSGLPFLLRTPLARRRATIPRTETPRVRSS